jgi:hypothetical protein
VSWRHPTQLSVSRKIFFGTILLFASIVFAIGGANAQGEVSERFGDWRFFQVLSNGGRTICGINSSNGGRSFHIKHFEGDNSFTIHLFRNSWRFDRRAEVRVIFRIGTDFTSEEVTGIAHPAQGQSSALVEFVYTYDIPLTVTAFEAGLRRR